MSKITRKLFTFIIFWCLTFWTRVYSEFTDIDREVKDTQSQKNVTNSKIVLHTFSNQTGYSEQNAKHELFHECPQIELHPEEFIIQDEFAILTHDNSSINSSWYTVKDGYLIICYPGWETALDEQEESAEKFPASLRYLNAAGMGLSMICLILHLIIFAFIKDFRNLPGYNLATLCLSLFASYSSYLAGMSKAIQGSRRSCVASAVVLHFFLFASFLWMNAIAFDILRSLRNAAEKLRLSTTKFKVRRFLSYNFYSWGISFLFVAISVTVDQTDFISIEYRPFYGQGICWINHRKALWLFFAAPVFFLITLNAVFFSLCAYTLYSNRMKGDETSRKIFKNHFVIFSKLAVIMGLTWTVGILAGLVNVLALWYIFVVLNTLQGLFIFFAFSFTQKVRKLFMKWLGFQEKRHFPQITSPTFQTFVSPFGSNSASESGSNNQTTADEAMK